GTFDSRKSRPHARRELRAYTNQTRRPHRLS
ncbi:MAG: hypothetical protein AVDCRST_MAG74-3910, partial [uncultured Pyrinomonadaceae bacterium]